MFKEMHIFNVCIVIICERHRYTDKPYSKMNNLPQDIHLQLPSWLEYVDQVAFAMVNRTISRNLIKHVRVIRLEKFCRDIRSFQERLRTYSNQDETCPCISCGKSFISQFSFVPCMCLSVPVDLVYRYWFEG